MAFPVAFLLVFRLSAAAKREPDDVRVFNGTGMAVLFIHPQNEHPVTDTSQKPVFIFRVMPYFVVKQNLSGLYDVRNGNGVI